jgi:hypothetical protein
MQTKLKEPGFEETFSETIFLSIYNTDVNEVPLSKKECMSISVRTGLTLLQLHLLVHSHYTLHKYIKHVVYISRSIALRYISTLCIK